MPSSREQIVSRIRALKDSALAALSERRPEIAAPLLKRALELHRQLRIGREAPCPAPSLDLLRIDDLEELQEDADRTALELDEFDPLEGAEEPPGKAPSQPNSLAVAQASEEGDTHEPHPLLPGNWTVDDEADVPAPDVPPGNVGRRSDPGTPIPSEVEAFPEPDLDVDPLTPYEEGYLEPDEWETAEDGTEITHAEPFEHNLEELESSLPEPEEFDESPTWDELQEVRTGTKLTRRERALQEAITLGRQFGWDFDGIELLAEVFALHWWSSAKQAMARALSGGMTSHELELALVVRKVWREHPEFHANFGRSRFAFAHPSLPWPTALAIARQYFCTPDEDEIIVTLQELYDEWRWSPTATEEFMSFYAFVRLQYGFVPQTLSEQPGWSFVPDADTRTLEDEPELSQLANYWRGSFRTQPAPTQD